MGKPGYLRNVLAGINYSGIDRLFQQYEDALGMIFTLHHVSPQPEQKFSPNAHLTIHPDFLDAAVRLLKRRSIEIVSLDEARARIQKPRSEGRFAAFTFDDGYRDNFEHAYPILKHHDVPFTLYVATGLVEGTSDVWWEGVEMLIRQQTRLLVQTDNGPLELDCSNNARKLKGYHQLFSHLSSEISEKERRRKLREICWLYKIDLDAHREQEVMTWPEIRQMNSDPLCTIGAHTVDHFILSRLEAKEVRQEMNRSVEVLTAELGVKPTHFAYPYGMPSAAGPREFDIARGLRFRTAVTTRPGMIYPEHRDHLTALPRISINGLFQRMRYFAPLTSGLPTRMANGFRRLNVGA